MKRHRVTELARDELTDIAAFASSLEPDDLATPSLCTRWRVADVLAHLYWTAVASPTEVIGVLAAGRFRPGPRMAEAFCRTALRVRHDLGAPLVIRTLEELASGAQQYGFATKVTRPREYLVDYVVHHMDIRRPLRRRRVIPEERLAAALAAVPSTGGLIGTRRRARGLRLDATDIGWRYGAGPLVRGSGEALLLALSGRGTALSELEGDGVPVLLERVDR